MPKSFENCVLARQALSQGLLQSVRLVGEYRGKESLFKQQSPQVLQALREGALIQSTESSNRIEGVVAPPQRIRELVAKRTQPANRSEQEIAGYREVLNTIQTNFADMQLTPNLVLQLHRDLFQFVPGGGGRWKATDNDITETRPDGTKVVRFKPLTAHLTPDAMARLHDAYHVTLDTQAVEPLLLISAYVLDFLCVHPFADANAVADPPLSGGVRGRPLHLARGRDRGDEGGLLRVAVHLVAGMARRSALARAMVGVFRGRDAREGVS